MIGDLLTTLQTPARPRPARLPAGPLRVVILSNPASGRGRGAAMAVAVGTTLSQGGHQAVPLVLAGESPEAFQRHLRAALADADLLVVVGGDGTVHHALSAALHAAVPLYHVPLGTENLFARQFRMDRRPETLAAALRARRTLDVDVGLATVRSGNGPAAVPKPFVLMCSLGPDASVVRRLALVRSGPISHLSYIRPIMAELMSPWIPRVTVEVDGERLVDGRRGMVVVANSRQYAVRIDPACDASMSDGLLDVVFLPSTGGARAGAWLLSARLRRHRRNSTLIYRQGRSIRVTTDDPSPSYQVDGESGQTDGAGIDLGFTVNPQALRVLAPGEST